MAANAGFAIPLCLPNNCQWNKQTGEVSSSSEQRNSLYVVDETLDQLKKIKGPVCVVSIAGPCRKGKSYILSKVFDQGEVFPLGRYMDPETMGIWMWIVPEKIKDTNGHELTVVLLDSEGTNAVQGEGSDDHCIFTLTILLASVLVYNSAGNPSRNDLEELDFIVNLSQCIRIRSTDQQGTEDQEDSKFFFKTFPYFIWLLRDVFLQLPRDCSNTKEFFLKRVFKSESGSQDDNAGKVGESILNFFPGFDAFTLSSPASEPEVLLNLNREEVQQDINKSFIRGVQEFKALLFPKLSPKRSFQDGECVTGEALASLVNIYVEALNTPGMVPNVQSAWETHVHKTCTDAKSAAEKVYDKAMSTQLVKCKLPCDSDDIRKIQKNAVEESMAVFQAETVGISAISSVKYLEKLMEYMEENLKALQERNNNLTREECGALLKRLKEERLDPIIAQLYTEDGSSVSFADIVSGYSAIEESFKGQSRGAKDVCAQVFYEFHPELQKDMQKHIALLERLIDYDLKEAQRKAELAHMEQERKRIEEQNKRIQDERETKEQEMKLLQKKMEEDRRRLEEQFRIDLETQRVLMQDMMTANMDELRSERQAIIDQNQILRHTMEEQNKRIQDERKTQQQEMKLLQKKMEEDRRRLEEQFRIDLETQRVLMQDMMTANMDELRSERQATIDQNQILVHTVEEQNKRIEEERKTQQQEMKLLQKEQEDDRRRLEEQFRTDMETQRVFMQDMMTTNIDELRIGRQAIIDQNQTLQDTITSMNEDMERRDSQMLKLQNQITVLANRPPPPQPKKSDGCVIL